jgi:hypothetical protein
MEDDTTARSHPARLSDRVVNCYHSCGLRSSCVSCSQVISLARVKLVRVSVIPSDMGNTCSLQSFYRTINFIIM